MSAPKHTLDWRLIGVDNTEAVISDAYGPVARVFRADRSKPQYVGNYKLIAAAPALADALEAVIAERALGCAGSGCGSCIECHCRTALRAAGRLP